MQLYIDSITRSFSFVSHIVQAVHHCNPKREISLFRILRVAPHNNVPGIAPKCVRQIRDEAGVPMPGEFTVSVSLITSNPRKVMIRLVR